MLTTRTLAEKISYRSGDTMRLPIPRDLFIRQISLLLTIYGATGATPPTPSVDSALGLIRRIRLVKNGADTLVDVKPIRFWKLLKYDFGTPPPNYLITDTNYSGILGRGLINIHFAINKTDLFDFSALLEAYMCSSLDLFIEWGVDTDIGGGYGISNAKIEVELIEAPVTKEIASMDIADVCYLEIEKVVDAKYDNYSFVVNLPTGNILRRVGVFAYNGGAYSDDLITYLKVQQASPRKADILESSWPMMQLTDKIEYGLESIEKGFTIIDFAPILDARRLKTGDINFMASTIAPTSPASVVLLVEEIR